MRSPGDRGATKPGKLRPSSFKASPQPSTPSRPTPSPVPAPAHTIQDPRKPQNCLGGGGGGPLRTKASPTLVHIVDGIGLKASEIMQLSILC